MTSRPAVTALLLTLLAGCAGAADDESIQRGIAERLEQAGLAQDADVQVEVVDGIATLTGVALSLPAVVSSAASSRECR